MASPSTPIRRSSSSCWRAIPPDGSAPVPVDSGGYFEHTTHAIARDFRRQAVLALERIGISVEFSHHEVAPGQQEIDLRYADALTTADNIMTFRHVVKEVALSHGVRATFMPKPFTDQPGSGMHTHLSLFEGERNAFHDPSDPMKLSKVARSFIAGLLTHAREYAAITNQWVNSYKRLFPQALPDRITESPAYVCWGHLNRSALVRVPAYGKPNSARVEVRSLDSACNPYLAYAVLLGAGLKGIEQGYELPPGAEDDVWSLSDAERRAMGYETLPGRPRRGDRRDGRLGVRRRGARRARLRFLPAQQARRMGGVPPGGHAIRAAALPRRAVDLRWALPTGDQAASAHRRSGGPVQAIACGPTMPVTCQPVSVWSTA